MIEFWLKKHWQFVLKGSSIASDNGLASTRRQAIIKTIDG